MISRVTLTRQDSITLSFSDINFILSGNNPVFLRHIKHKDTEIIFLHPEKTHFQGKL